MSDPKLTIAIPTFNRPKQLASTLERLIPQLTADWVLHIHDNCSESGVAETHGEVLSKVPAAQLTVFRNRVNLGAIANVLSCYERCTTEWIVVLGDDDEVLPNYAETFLNMIADQPDLAFANFTSSLFSRERAFHTSGVAEFATKMDDWSNVLFISTNLFNCTALLPYLRYGYMYGYSLAPHIAMVLQFLKEQNGQCLFATTKVVNHRRDLDTVSWSLVYANNFALILELLPDRHSQKALFYKMRKYFLPPKEMALRLAATGCKTGEDQRLQFRLRSTCYTCLENSLLRGIKRFLLEHALRFPRILPKLLRRRRGDRADQIEENFHAGH